MSKQESTARRSGKHAADEAPEVLEGSHIVNTDGTLVPTSSLHGELAGGRRDVAE